MLRDEWTAYSNWCAPRFLEHHRVLPSSTSSTQPYPGHTSTSPSLTGTSGADRARGRGPNPDPQPRGMGNGPDLRPLPGCVFYTRADRRQDLPRTPEPLRTPLPLFAIRRLFFFFCPRSTPGVSPPTPLPPGWRRRPVGARTEEEEGKRKEKAPRLSAKRSRRVQESRGAGRA